MAEVERHNLEETNAHFRLLDLPLELRIMIYEFVVFQGIIDPTNISVVTFRSKTSLDFHFPGDDEWTTSDQSIIPPMLQTCRQLRQEGFKVYYGYNTFIIRPRCRPSPNGSEQWLKSRSSEAVASMRRILVLSPAHCTMKMMHGRLRALIDLKNGDFKWMEQIWCPNCYHEPEDLAMRVEEVRGIIEEARTADGIDAKDIWDIGHWIRCTRRRVEQKTGR